MPPGCPGRGSWKAGQVDEPRGWAREALTSRPPSALSQTQLKTQNSRIEQLFHKVAQQQRHLEKQQLKIQKLQSQVPDATPPTPAAGAGGGSSPCGCGLRTSQVAQRAPAQTWYPPSVLSRWASWAPCIWATGWRRLPGRRGSPRWHSSWALLTTSAACTVSVQSSAVPWQSSVPATTHALAISDPSWSGPSYWEEERAWLWVSMGSLDSGKGLKGGHPSSSLPLTSWATTSSFLASQWLPSMPCRPLTGAGFGEEGPTEQQGCGKGGVTAQGCLPEGWNHL